MFSEWCLYRTNARKMGLGHITDARIGGADFLKITDLDGRVVYHAAGTIAEIVPSDEETVRRLAVEFGISPDPLPASSTQ